MKNNKDGGFSLIELIIVVAIMAVLVGVMAPQYAKYLERTKRTKDCTSIGIVLDACEVMGVDPDTTWGDGTTNQITITIGSNGTTYSGGANSELNGYVPSSNVKLEEANWGPFVINAIKASDGSVTFDITNDNQIAEIRKYSEAIANRLN